MIRTAVLLFLVPGCTRYPRCRGAARWKAYRQGDRELAMILRLVCPLARIPARMFVFTGKKRRPLGGALSFENKLSLGELRGAAGGFEAVLQSSER